MNIFLSSYVETALWSSTDNDGVPLDNIKYANTELAEETISRMRADCEAFLKATEHLEIPVPQAQIAHDFWLTRNRHGAGFWDGDYPEPLAKELTDIAHGFGECDLYVGDDGKFYLF